MKYIIITFCITFLYSCSSFKSYTVRDPLTFNHHISNVEYQGELISIFPDLNQKMQFKLLMARRDSISLEIYGPLSIVVGKLFAYPDYFLFYNVLQFQAFEGKPDAKNFNNVINVPLSYSDFVSYLRGEPSQSNATFIFDSSYSEENKLLYKSLQGDFVDFVLIDKKQNVIVQQQRKELSGKLVINVLYNDYKVIDNQKLPSHITLSYPELDGSLILKCSSIEINKSYSKSFKFNVPSSIEKIRLN